GPTSRRTGQPSSQEQNMRIEEAMAEEPVRDHGTAPVSQMPPVKARRALENSAIVRKLLRQRQPEFAAALASAEHYFSCPCGRAKQRYRRDDRAQVSRTETGGGCASSRTAPEPARQA